MVGFRRTVIFTLWRCDMIGDVSKDVDEELVDNFFRSPEGTWRVWKKIGEESPLEPGTWRAMIQIAPNIPEKEVKFLERFSRNDTSRARRPESDRAWVCLPALELQFEDPDNPGNFYSGFIEGKKNINKFFLALAERHNKEFSLVKIAEQTSKAPGDLSDAVERAMKSLEDKDDTLRE